MVTVGMLHPGRMGAAVGAQISGVVVWCPPGRSEATGLRAAKAGLEPAASLEALAQASDVIISLCPPANAVEVATSVAATGFAGVYVDGNAIAPARVREIARLFDTAQVVDGCVIGPPPHSGNGTRLYLSGESQHAQQVAGLFDGSAVEAVLIDGEIGQASALKMAFGSYNKATGVLAAVSHALADAYGVGDHLQAAAGDGHLADPGYLTSVAARAWRWAPEMREVAATLDEAGLPADLALAAASVLESWDGDRDDFEISFREVLDHLRR